MRRIIFTTIVFLITYSCKDNNRCITKEMNTALIDEYLIVSDTCDTFKNFPYTKYYYDDKLLMSGFNKRNNKQGEWYFFNGYQKGIKGFFKNSQPQGTWNFKLAGKINWDIHNDSIKNCSISLPINWMFVESPDGNSFGIFDSKVSEDFENYNLKIAITSVSLTKMKNSIKVLYENTIKSFKNSGFKNIQYKPIDIKELDESYKIKYEEQIGNKVFLNNETFYVFNNRLYVLSHSINKQASSDFSIIKEIIYSSFKIYE